MYNGYLSLAQGFTVLVCDGTPTRGATVLIGALAGVRHSAA
jgi:hypothetical protein